MTERFATIGAVGMERESRLRGLAVERLTLPEMQHVADSFGSHIRSGLEGRASSLTTIPTILKPVDLESISPHKQALVVEIGGTNVYGGIVQVEHGKVRLLQHVTQPLRDDGSRTYTSNEDFFARVASGVAPLLSESIDTLGIIWSFPATIQESPHGIDAVSVPRLPKELVVPDIEKVPVGDQLIRALRAKNSTIPEDLGRVVANDTAAVLLANGGTLGGIVGTGFNFAFSHNGQIYNLEAGGFSDVPQTQLTRQLDAESETPGHYLAEKQISGKYIEDEFSLSAQALRITNGEHFSAQEIGQLLSRDIPAFRQKHTDLSFDNIATLKELAAVLTDRSAQLVASMIAGVILAFPQDFQKDGVTIPIEGSFFGKTPGYKETVSMYIHALLPETHVSLLPVSKSGIKGAGVAALSLLQ